MSDKRTDPYRPSVLQAVDCHYRLAFGYAGMGSSPPYGMRALGDLRAAHLASGGTVHRHPHGGCAICGASFRHGCVFLHAPTNALLTVGWQCAEALEFLGEEFGNTKREAFSEAKRAADHAANRRNLREFAESTPKPVLRALRLDHPIAHDMRARVLSRPERGLSDKQQALLLKLQHEADNPKPEEKHAPAPVTDKRIRIVGRVVSIKWRESYYGGSLKLTVKVTTPEGVWLAWGTCPSAIEPEAGDTVAFTARLEVSEDKPHFSFFKRPTKAEVLKTSS